MSDHPGSDSKLSRRTLLGALPLTGIALGAAPPAPGEAALLKPPRTTAKSVIGMRFEPMERVRLGIVGVGGRGTGMMRNFLAVEGVQVTAVCDIVEQKAVRAQSIVERAGQKAPATYTKGERDFENLCQRDDIDMVVTATPWKWHVPVSVCAMTHGKHAATEVPAATSLQECWQLVDTSEKTRRHCVLLENCCYGENEMLILNMVRAGVLGELTHGACAYNHDLRGELFSNQGEGLWRRFEHLRRDANLYPTHGLGPVANYMSIHRGDRFVSLVSMSSIPKSLAYYRDHHLPPDDPRRKEVYKTGDENISLIKTATGLLIRLEHNVSSPMPYDRINMIAGTKGIFYDYPPRIYIDGETKTNHMYEPIDRYKEKFQHPLWEKTGDLARKMGGHGGMDYIECFRLIQCMKEGLPPDIDVYDAAAWSAPTPLSEMSIAQGSSAVPFPDFTRGNWQKART